jgi:hypothetical protein
MVAQPLTHAWFVIGTEFQIINPQCMVLLAMQTDGQINLLD